jgi:uncharacterized membrane protein
VLPSSQAARVSASIKASAIVTRFFIWGFLLIVFGFGLNTVFFPTWFKLQS